MALAIPPPTKNSRRSRTCIINLDAPRLLTYSLWFPRLAAEYLFLADEGSGDFHDVHFEPFNARSALNDYEVSTL